MTPGTATLAGLLVGAGNSNTVKNTEFQTSTGFSFGMMWGDGSYTIGSNIAQVPNNSPAPKGFGTINAQKGIYLNGVPIFPFQDQIPEDPTGKTKSTAARRTAQG